MMVIWNPELICPVLNDCMIFLFKVFLGISVGGGLLAGLLTVCLFYVGLFLLGKCSNMNFLFPFLIYWLSFPNQTWKRFYGVHKMIDQRSCDKISFLYCYITFVREL